MKKIVRLTETDLSNIVRQIIKEASGTPIKVAAKKGTYIDPTGKTIAANKLPTELNPGQKLGGMSPDAELLILYSQSGGAAKYVTIKSDTKNLSYENLAYLAVKAPQKTSDVVQRSGVVQRESRFMMNEQITPKQCAPNKLSIVKNNFFSGKPTSYKVRIENNVSAGMTDDGSSSVLFVTLGNEPVCWCKPSDLI